MTSSGSQSWLLSVGLHLILGVGVLTLLSLKSPSAPHLVRMHLVSGSPARSAAHTAKGQAWWVGSRQTEVNERSIEPQTPDWQVLSLPIGQETSPPPATASLDEILDSVAPPAETSASTAFSSSSVSGWSSAAGEGYAPPPLPPPGLAPPGGAGWSLVVTVPGGGGFAVAVDGLDSGHPALDRWLEVYLRTVSFPSAPDGQPYQTRWTLHLETGKPQ